MKDRNKNLRPIIFWDGFPVCALLIKKVAEEFGDDLVIMATSPAVPFQGLEETLGHKIIWLKDPNEIWKRREEFSDRNFIIHSAWTYRGWLKYSKMMRDKNNAKVVVAVDNRYRGDFRQYVGALWFRLFLKKYFDAVLVPGKSGIKLMKFLGMETSSIYTGLYGAYEGIFKEIMPIEKRNKEFLFVGQLITRKSVDILMEAFQKYRQEGGTWNLRIVGSGPLESMCQGEGIILEGFAQPEENAVKMNTARVLVLPSRDDNWGTVVCEAAACGMHIIASRFAGASEDIIQEGVNGVVLPRVEASLLKDAFFYYQNLEEASLLEGSRVSKEIASNYNSSSYLEAFTKMANNL